MFHHCETIDEGKKLFRRLALRLHPDCGGDADLMILLQESYEMFEEFNSKNEPEDAFAAFTQEPIKPKKEKKPRPTSYPGRYQPVNVQMSAENQDFLNLIDEMLEFARNNERFDPGTTLSIRESATEKGHVTVNQYNALVHVYYAFKMDRKQEPQPTV